MALGSAFQVAPHVRELDWLTDERSIVLFDHDAPHTEGAPTQNDASAGGNLVSTIFYACAMATIGLVMAAIWWHVGAHNRLLAEPLAPHVFRSTLLRYLFVPGIFLASIGIAFWDPNWAAFSWVLIALGALLWRRHPSR